MKLTSPLERLNLHHLRALDALLAERSVTRAAGRLGVTQSAVSHALRGLRETLDDALLVRGPGGMVPTPRAEALAAPLRRALGDLEAALDESPVFAPATSRRTFTLGMGDGFTLTILPPLLAHLRISAPGVDLNVVPVPGGRTASVLTHSDLDLTFGVMVPEGDGLRTRALFDDDFACLIRRDHPEVGEQMDLDTYCRLPHALMSPSGSGPGIVDRVLAESGRSRRVALRIRYFLAAPLVVAHSDLVLTGPRRQLVRLAEHAPLRVLDPPIALPTFTRRIFWHARLQRDPGHRWLREVVATTSGEARVGS